MAALCSARSRRRAMFASPFTLLALALFAPEPAVEIKLVPVAPAQKAVDGLQRTPGIVRAVVLLHGLRPHPISETNVWEAELSGWEEPSSPLVKMLSADADV